MKKILLAFVALLTLAVQAQAEYEGDTAPPYSVVKVVRESKACWPAYSGNWSAVKKVSKRRVR
jgi:hypothetical protein